MLDEYIPDRCPPASSGGEVKMEAVLETERLRLRRWNDSDREPFAALNADPLVMEYFTSTPTRAESDDFIDRVEAHFDRTGFGLWAVEVVASSEFAGFVGLWPPNFDAHFTPAIEVGWRLARRFWGQGFAPEAAQASVADGFQRLEFGEIVSFTSATNLKSRRVMEKLGMTRDPSDDSEHPNVHAGDPLKPHVLYRLTPTHSMTRPRKRARGPGSTTRYRPYFDVA